MTSKLWSKIERILPEVEKPTRYIGGEWNAVRKEVEGRLKVALVYPDVYEIGLSNLGLQILYELLNNEEDVVAERSYAPWVDMEARLRQEKIPLFSLESQLPLGDFDIIGFSLQHEMTYTNVLNILDLAGLPLRAGERDENHPLVIGGGPCAFNPEPLADFFDLFVIGEGEEVILELTQIYRKWKTKGRSKGQLLEELASLEGVYVPLFYEVGYNPDGTVAEVKTTTDKATLPVRRRVLSDLEKTFLPLRPIVPFIEAVHDRASLEIMRGCTRGCRFCQAGVIYRPVRERKKSTLSEAAGELLAQTGYGELSLVSLSTSDYTGIVSLVKDLAAGHFGQGVSISLPSLRVDSFSVELASHISQAKKTGLTFAPEAGTERLRNVINKQLTKDDLFKAAHDAFRAGWRKLKLYFMIGLPAETQDDLQAILDLVKELVQLGLRIVPPAKRSRFRLTVNISPFVPKCQSPFQWVAQNNLPELEEKIKFFKKNLRSRWVNLRWHDARQSCLEAVLARGDRRLSRAIERAWELGSRFDSWTEEFHFDLWGQAFKESEIDIDFYACRERGKDEIFPWDHLDCGVSKEFLWSEYQKALLGEPTPDCRWNECLECGVCQTMNVETRVESEDAPVKS